MAVEVVFYKNNADSGNGTYPHTQPLVYVTGSNWSLNIIHKPTGGEFTPSAMRIKFAYVSGSFYKFDIESNDSGNDSDFNRNSKTVSMHSLKLFMGILAVWQISIMLSMEDGTF